MNLDRILRTGDEVRIRSNHDIFTTTVDEITGDNTLTILPPFKPGQQTVVNAGDAYSVTCITDRGLYMFDAVVTSIDSEARVPVIHLLTMGELKKTQRRQAFRVNEMITVNARKVAGENAEGKWLKTYSVDVSELGLLIRFDEPCEYGQELELTLRINQHGITDVITKIRGRVVRCVGIRHRELPYLVGLKFENLPERARDTLIKLVVLSQRSKLTYKNLKKFR